MSRSAFRFQSVILAGGLGTRLAPITDLTPKPLVEVNGEPFLSHLLRLLKSQGCHKVLILTGYRGNQIEDHYGNEFEGLELGYSSGPKEWSTGQRLIHAKNLIDDDFLLLYGDNYALFDIAKLREIRSAEGSSLCLSVIAKNDGNILLSETGKVESYLEKRGDLVAKHVEVGFIWSNKSMLIQAILESNGSLPGALGELARKEQISAHVIHHPYFSVSDRNRLEKTRTALSDRRIILIDRDGVINVKPEKGAYVTDSSSFTPISSTWDAMSALSNCGFEFVIITNQAGVARGQISPAALTEIHAKMLGDLEKVGIVVRHIHVCDHHWEDDCPCRKPKPGMLWEAASQHDLILNRTVFIGDDIVDELAALAAGSSPILIGRDCTPSNPQTPVFPTLLDAMHYIKSFYGLVAQE